MNNLTIGGVDSRTGKPFAYYETLGGGMGAWRGGDGESAVHSHMTNTLNTPVEALEYSYPFRMKGYGVRTGTGGSGKRQGGDGLVREVELLAESEVTVLSERRTRGGYGLAGGGAAGPGRNSALVDGKVVELPGKFSQTLPAGSILRIETPGGGGWGGRDG